MTTLRRRTLLALPALPGLARAQGLPRIGVLMSLAETDPEAAPRRAALVAGLAALGWKQGETLRLEIRWGDGRAERIAAEAAAMVASAPAVIVANGTPVALALRPLTRSIPVVCALVTDRIGNGMVESLARPGGNITGFTFIEPGLIAKWLGLLKEVAPGLTRAAVVYNPAFNPWYPRALAEIARAPQGLPVAVVETIVRTAEEIEARLPDLAQVPGTGLVIGPESFVLPRLPALAAAARAQGLPGVSVYPRFAEVGGLMAYGPDVPDIFRRAAGYVDRILRGASPATLPVQQPERFAFTLNQATATTLGLTLPPALLAAADRVID